MPETKQYDNTEKVQKRKTIFLVDDAVVQLRAMKNILSDKYNVEMATSGRMAIEILITGVNERKRIMDVLKMNPAGYLIKPMQREDLLKIVHQLLEEQTVPVLADTKK